MIFLVWFAPGLATYAAKHAVMDTVTFSYAFLTIFEKNVEGLPCWSSG